MSTTEPDRSEAASGTTNGPTRQGRVGTIVWGLVIVALAALIVISQLEIIALNGTYVLVGLMIGAGAALVIGGIISARRRDNGTTTGKG